jgi:Fic family protein
MPATVTLVPSGLFKTVMEGSGTFRAFIPAPLPPKIDWTWPLSRRLSEADRAVGELAGLGLNLPNPHLLIEPLLRKEAVLSSAIEGTQTNIEDLYAFEAAKQNGEQTALPMPKPPSDAEEVANYVAALSYGIDRLSTLPVSLRLLQELHTRLMRNVRGEEMRPGDFRERQNWLGTAGCSVQEARFVPPPVAEMHAALQAFEQYLHATSDEYPPLVRLALIHYQFETIHPFLDGNGRIGRLLISLLLVHWNLIPLPLLYLSAFLERNRDQYADLLLAVSVRSAWPEWIDFFLDGIAQQARESMAKVKSLMTLLQDWRTLLMSQPRTSAMAVRLVESLFVQPFVQITSVAAELNTSYNTAQALVLRLVELKILQQLGSTSYGRWFYAPAVIRTIAS